MPKHSVRLPRHKAPMVSTVVVGLLVLTLAGLSLVFLDKSASINDPKAVEARAPVSYTHLTLPTNREV